MSKRVNPPSSMKARLLSKNKNVCCVCKEHGLGLVFHHIDGNPTHTVDENLAVLCVKDHDWHHRPNGYSEPRHLELSVNQIKAYKKSWEAFVEETAKPRPKVIGVLNAYGRGDYIHAVRLTFQWEDGKAELDRLYHLTDAPPEILIDKILEEANWLGNGITILLIDEVLEVEYCPNCKKDNIYTCTHITVDGNIVKKHTTETWQNDSYATIYIYPNEACLAITIFLKGEPLFMGHLSRYANDLHFHYEGREERIPIAKKAVRTQVTKFVEEVLLTWEPSKILIGTGNPNSPTLIEKLILPKIWEKCR